MPCVRKEQYGKGNTGSGIGQEWRSLNARVCMCCIAPFVLLSIHTNVNVEG